jgi:hypothetical protein
LPFFIAANVPRGVADFLPVAIGQPRRDEKDHDKNEDNQQVHGAIPHERLRSGILALVSNMTRGILPFPFLPENSDDWLPR